jgi:hypothetical protein
MVNLTINLKETKLWFSDEWTAAAAAAGPILEDDRGFR